MITETHTEIPTNEVPELARFHRQPNKIGIQSVWVLVDFKQTTNYRQIQRVKLDWNCKMAVAAFARLADTKLRSGWTVTTRRVG